MSDIFFSGFVTGVGVGLALMAIADYLVIRTRQPMNAKRFTDAGKKYVPVLLALLAGALLFGVGGVRADTPVPLTIPTNDIFTAANNWIATFAPIASIGIGISIALAVLGYLGTMIVKAFHT